MDLIDIEEVQNELNNNQLIENIKISQKLYIPWFHLLSEKSKEYIKIKDIQKLIDNENISNLNNDNDPNNNQLVINNTYNYLKNIDKIKKGDVVSLFDKKKNNVLILEIVSDIKYSEIHDIKIVSRINKKCIHKKFNSDCIECLDNIITITNSYDIHNYLEEDVIIEKYYSIYKEIKILDELDSLTVEILSKHYKNFPIGIKNSKIVIEI